MNLLLFTVVISGIGSKSSVVCAHCNLNFHYLSNSAARYVVCTSSDVILQIIYRVDLFNIFWSVVNS